MICVTLERKEDHELCSQNIKFEMPMEKQNAEILRRHMEISLKEENKVGCVNLRVVTI